MSALPPDEMLVLLLARLHALERQMAWIVTQFEKLEREVNQRNDDDDETWLGGTD